MPLFTGVPMLDPTLVLFTTKRLKQLFTGISLSQLVPSNILQHAEKCPLSDPGSASGAAKENRGAVELQGLVQCVPGL